MPDLIQHLSLKIRKNNCLENFPKNILLEITNCRIIERGPSSTVMMLFFKIYIFVQTTKSLRPYPLNKEYLLYFLFLDICSFLSVQENILPPVYSMQSNYLGTLRCIWEVYDLQHPCYEYICAIEQTSYRKQNG